MSAGKRTCDVDRQSRANLQRALIQYMRGDIRTFAFDDQNSLYLPPCDATDRGLHEIAGQLYCIHDDLVDHPISVTPECWEALRRIVAFLSTDLQGPSAVERHTWPFSDEGQWRMHEPRLQYFDLPEYDPLVHGRAINHWHRRIPTSVGVAVIIGLIAIAAFAVMST